MKNYLRTIKNYLKTPKGRHDFLDYLKAIVLIILTSLIIFLIMVMCNEKKFIWINS